jgi:hypothetical protein
MSAYGFHNFQLSFYRPVDIIPVNCDSISCSLVTRDVLVGTLETFEKVLQTVEPLIFSKNIAPTP